MYHTPAGSAVHKVKVQKFPVGDKMVANAVTGIATPSKIPLFPGFQFQRSSRSLQLRMSQKAGHGVITGKLELRPPPYPLDALEPHMSRSTFEYHWGKHHRAYVDNLNKQIAGTELTGKTLEDVIVATYNSGNLLPPFNNAAQVWNHDFFWESMKPDGGGKPSGELLDLINRDFGSFEEFAKEFKTAAATQFGSGWAWLVYKDEDKKLAVVQSPNAVNPLVWDQVPLLTVDVWEHAYYLDYQNRRPDYLSIFMENLVSWDAVSSRLESAKAGAA